MKFAEENLLAMGAAFENFRRPSAVHANSRFSEGEGVFPIRSDLPQFGVVRERTVVRGRVRAFEFFSLDADLFPVGLDDEAGGEGFSRGNGFGEGVLEGVCGNGFEGVFPSIKEERSFLLTRRHFPPQGQERLRDENPNQRLPRSILP